MSERPYSLIDVQLGMFRIDLNLLLTPPLFTFFWGLVMTANKLTPRFKNPFDLTVIQGQAAGGGNSRQALWQRQQNLKKVRIEKQWLVKIKCGNKQKNVPATYEINYNLLVPSNLAVPAFEGYQSKILDGSVDATMTDPLTDPLTILRSEENREDSIEDDFAQWLMKEFRNCVPGTGWRPESDNERERFNELCNAPKDKLEVILTDARLKGISARGLLKWVEGGLANYEKFHGKGNGKSKKVYRDPHKEIIDSLMGMYHDYQDGTLPASGSIPADSVAVRLRMSLGSVAEHIDELDYSVEAYEALIDRWEKQNEIS